MPKPFKFASLAYDDTDYTAKKQAQITHFNPARAHPGFKKIIDTLSTNFNVEMFKIEMTPQQVVLLSKLNVAYQLEILCLGEPIVVSFGKITPESRFVQLVEKGGTVKLEVTHTAEDYIAIHNGKKDTTFLLLVHCAEERKEYIRDELDLEYISSTLPTNSVKLVEALHDEDYLIFCLTVAEEYDKIKDGSAREVNLLQGMNAGGEMYFEIKATVNTKLVTIITYTDLNNEANLPFPHSVEGALLLHGLSSQPDLLFAILVPKIANFFLSLPPSHKRDKALVEMVERWAAAVSSPKQGRERRYEDHFLAVACESQLPSGGTLAAYMLDKVSNMYGQKKLAKYNQRIARILETFEENKSKMHVCAFCNEAMYKMSRCSACSVTYYCSVEHQKAHWKQHKLECKRVK